MLKIIRVGLLAALCVHFIGAPAMASSGNAHRAVLVTGASCGILSGRTGTSYSMSKHAIESYADSLAAEMEEHGVAVSVVEPGSCQSRTRDAR